MTLTHLIATGMTWGYVISAVALYAVAFIASLLAVGFVLVELPAAYFLDGADRHLWVDRHPVVRLLLRFAKNLIGLCLVLVGLLLSLPGIPGQGLLTVLIGVMLLDFPGKRAWERKLVGQPRVLAAINRLRTRFGKSPLQLAQTPQEAYDPSASAADPNASAAEESPSK